MSVCDITLDVGSQPLSPDDHIPLMKMQYSAKILEDQFASFGGINWFAPEVKAMELTGDIAIGQSLRIRFKDYENPLKKVGVSDVVYKAGETCPPIMDATCEPGCISTAPSWRYCDVLFDKKYTIGASYCVETERLTYSDLDERFRDSVEANKEAQSIFAWNELVCQAIADPAATLIPTDTACFPTHYIADGGLASLNGYKTLTDVIAYMKTVFGRNDFAIFAHRYFETDILEAGSTLHNYSNTGIPTAWGNVDALVQGGWKPMPALPGGLWGQKIFIAPDSVNLYDGTTNYNPFLNEDGTKYRVVIASKRSFFTGVTELMDMRRFPATCDNKNESIQETFLGYNKILFPNEVFVIEFDVSC